MKELKTWPAEFASAEILLREDRTEVFEFVSPNDASIRSRFSLQNSTDADRLMDKIFVGEPLSVVHVSLALRTMADGLENQSESWAKLIAFEGGKPIRQARIEVQRAALTLRWSASEAERVSGQVIPLQSAFGASDEKSDPKPWAWTELEPAGPVLAILAFNHPLNLLAHAVGPALAARCPIVVKPALEVAHTAHRFCQEFERVWREVSSGPAPVSLALWSHSLAHEKLSDPRWGAVQFVGSSRIGWSIARRVHPGVRVLLEHGGAAPAIVAEDANLKAAAQALCRHGYLHSGQVCVSLQRVFVVRSVAEEFLNLFADEVRALKMGDARDEGVDCGPLIRPQDADRVEQWVQEVHRLGAEIRVGGNRRGENFFEPTLIVGLPETARMSSEEIFGPVVAVQSVDSLDEAVRRANSTPWIFQASVWSNSVNQLRGLSKQLRATAVICNEGPSFRVDWMPFRGEGLSGRGVGGVPGHVRELMREKLIVVR